LLLALVIEPLIPLLPLLLRFVRLPLVALLIAPLPDIIVHALPVLIESALRRIKICIRWSLPLKRHSRTALFFDDTLCLFPYYFFSNGSTRKGRPVQI
jgi:hypothetical protein